MGNLQNSIPVSNGQKTDVVRYASETSLPKRYIPEDVNINRLPFFASDTRDFLRVLEYKSEVRAHDGSRLEIEWKVSPNATYGLPGPFAQLVHHILLEIAFEQGYPIKNPIYFELNEICRRLGYSTDKNGKFDSKLRKRIQNAIRSIQFSAIICKGAYKLDGEYSDLYPAESDEAVSLYTHSAFVRRATKNREAITRAYVHFADWYIASLNSGYIRPIDRHVALRLSKKANSAPNLYRYLGYLFAIAFKNQEEFVDILYPDICQIIDKTPSRSLSKAKERFKRVHQALLDEELLATPIEWLGKGSKAKDYTIRYRPGTRAFQEYKQGRSSISNQFQLDLFDSSVNSIASPLFSKLIEFGFDEEGAVVMLKKYSHNDIALYIEYMEFDIEKNGKRIENKAGYLRSLLRKKKVTAPKGFVSQAERQEKNKKVQLAAREEEERKLQARKLSLETEKRYKHLQSLLSKREDKHEVTSEILEKMITYCKSRGDLFNSQRLIEIQRNGESPTDEVMYRHDFYQILEEEYLKK